MRGKKQFIYIGLFLIVTALLLVCYNVRLDQRAKIISDQALEELLAQIRENTSQSSVSDHAPDTKQDRKEAAAESDAGPEYVPEPEVSPENAEPENAEPENPEAVPEASEEPSTPAEQPEAAPQPKPTPTLSAGSYVGVISIPAISRTLPVASEVTEVNLKIAPCVYTGSPDQGNMVICGHNYKSHFAKLKNVLPGDEIIFTDLSGTEYHYTVSEIETLQPTAIQEMVFKDCDLTIFTCTTGGQSRLTVRCRKLDQ